MKKGIVSKKYSMGHMTIQTKLILGFMGVIATFMIGVTVNLVEQNYIGSLIDRILQRESELRLIQTLDYDVRKAVDDGAWFIMNVNPQKGFSFYKIYQSSVAVVGEDVAKLKSATHNTQSMNAINTFTTDWTLFKQHADTAFQLYQAKQQSSAQQIFTKDTVDHVVNSLVSDTNRQKMDIVRNEGNLAKAKQVALLVNLFLSLVAFVLAMGIALIFSRRISSSLRDLRNVTTKVANGNLQIGNLFPRSGDEIGQLVNATNEMVANLRLLVSSVYSTAEQLTASSQELAANSEQTTQSVIGTTVAVQQIAEGSIVQAQNSEEIQSTMREMSVGIQSGAQSASSVTEKAMIMTEQAIQGNEYMVTSVDRMDNIYKSVDHSTAMIQKLENHSQEIKQIVNIISDIATQTNLLALNAAIEAARAGEEGRGFAVVADEVRNLAQQSTNSAKNIEILIRTIEHDIAESVETMMNVKTSVESGVEMIKKSAKAFREILDANQIVSAEIQELSATSEEMAAAVQEVTSAVSQLASISELNSAELQNVSASTEEQMAVMEEVAASATALSELAMQLNSMVQRFKL